MASKLTQENRPFRVSIPSHLLEQDKLVLSSFSGTEAISRPFSYRLELYSEDPSIALDTLLFQQVMLTIDLENGEQRHIHGQINRFALVDEQEDIYTYRAELVPWLWFLSLTTDCKIFQDMDVLSIVEEVFDSAGITGLSTFDNRCVRSYEPRTYCVQYRETHLNFVSRLLEEEGIFYWFEHTESGSELVLADDNNLLRPCPHKETALLRPQRAPGGEDVVTDLRAERSLAHPAIVTLKDYDFEQPALGLLGQVATGESDMGFREVYDYHPGRFTDLDIAERYAALGLEAMEAERQRVTGAGDCRAFTVGTTVQLEDHFAPELNDRYLLLEVSHSGSAGDFRSWDTADLTYHNQFTAIPAGNIYRPPQLHRKPRIAGSQTAVVVGPSDEEVWTDEFGRVQIHFHWDRLSTPPHENASCWVRVATPWAGKNWGSVSIPRIGNEVVVDFLEGDPDQPLIIGSVYNADQMPPFELPASGVQMGIKTRSSKGGDGYNEISMTDTKDEEVMTIHAQKDRNTTVLGDETVHIKGNRILIVEGTDSGGAGAKTKGSGTSVTGDYKLNASSTIEIEAPTSITLICGGSQIKLEPAQISITSGGSEILVTPGHIGSQASGGAKVVLTGDAAISALGKASVFASGKASVFGSAVNIHGITGAELTSASSAKVSGGLTEITGGLVSISGGIVKVNS